MDLAKLVARLELQSSQFQSELEKTNQKLLGFQRQSTSSLRSIDKQAKEFSKNITGSLRAVNVAMGLLVGFGLKKAFQNIFTETANSSRDFANALQDVRTAARDLLASKDGAPAAANAMRELAETLKDPAVVQAADALTSSLILGFAGVTKGIAETIGGLKVLMGLSNDEVEELRVRIARLDNQIANRKASLPGAVGNFAANLRNEIASLEAERNQLSRRQLGAAELGPPKTETSFDAFIRSLPNNLPDFNNGELNLDSEISKQLAEFTKRENFIPGLDSEFTNRFKKFIDGFQDDINSGVIETAQRAAESIGEVGDALGEKIIGKAADLSVFAEEAARGVQSAFADFLFDPFSDGLDGMLAGFINVFRRMIAEVASAKILEGLFGTGTGGKSGLGSFLGGIFGGFLADGGPIQQGKWYVAGEHGPEPIWGGGAGAFAMGYGGGGGVNVTVAPVFNNMRDVTDAKMAVYAKQISDATIARIRDDRRHRKF